MNLDRNSAATQGGFRHEYAGFSVRFSFFFSLGSGHRDVVVWHSVWPDKTPLAAEIPAEKRHSLT